MKSWIANDVISGTALDQCQHGDMSCQKAFKQIETFETLFKQTKIIKAKIKCAPKNFLPQWIQKFLTKIHGYKRNFVNFKKLCIFHWVCLWFECYENKGFVEMKKHFNFLQEKHDVLNDLSWFGLNPSKIRNRQDLLKPTRRPKIWIYFRGNSDLFGHKRIPRRIWLILYECFRISKCEKHDL